MRMADVHGRRRRPEPVPWVFHEFCAEFLGLTGVQITTWWTALASEDA
jgi:hypothetical protein